jgi:hypothetical protein
MILWNHYMMKEYVSFKIYNYFIDDMNEEIETNKISN